MKKILTVGEMKMMRMALGIKQSEMADLLNVSSFTYLRYEAKEDMLLSQAIKCTDYLIKKDNKFKKLVKDIKEFGTRKYAMMNLIPSSA